MGFVFDALVESVVSGVSWRQDILSHDLALASKHKVSIRNKQIAVAQHVRRAVDCGRRLTSLHTTKACLPKNVDVGLRPRDERRPSREVEDDSGGCLVWTGCSWSSSCPAS